MSLCRRRRAGKFWSAVARRRSKKVGGRGATRSLKTKIVFSKILEKISLYPQHFLMTYFLIIEICNKINTRQKWHWRRADKLSAAAARRSTKVGGVAHILLAAAKRQAGARFYMRFAEPVLNLNSKIIILLLLRIQTHIC